MLKENIKNRCIIRQYGEKYKVVYSYDTGYYYLIPEKNFNLENYKEDGLYKLSYSDFNKCVKSAVNPAGISLNDIPSPVVMGIMFSNTCNLKCNYCIAAHAHSYSTKNILKDKYVELHKKIQDSQVVGIIISGGEPTMNASLREFLQLISSEIYLCELDTNGTNISDELIVDLKRLFVIPRVSLDSIYEEIHNLVRGRFKETMNTIKCMIDEEIEFRINTVLHEKNKKNIYDLGNWIYKNRINKWHIYKLQKRYADISLWVSDEEMINIVGNLKREFEKEIIILCKHRKKEDNFASFMIDSEGICFSTQNGEKVIFGNIFSSSINEIWDNTSEEFKRNHLKKFFYYEEKKSYEKI